MHLMAGRQKDWMVGTPLMNVDLVLGHNPLLGPEGPLWGEHTMFGILEQNSLGAEVNNLLEVDIRYWMDECIGNGRSHRCRVDQAEDTFERSDHLDILCYHHIFGLLRSLRRIGLPNVII